MKFSVFTPVHNCSRLRPAFESLIEQTYKNFEWVILLNQKASLDDELIKEICYKLKDKVTITHISDIENAKDNGYIGNYKKLCCSLASGDVLVELDYDDALEPCCLEVLKEHFDDDSVDFVYSSCFEYKDGKSVAPFNPKFGWQYNKCQDTNRFITLAFEPTPINFSYIWYAPNHVRSWRTKFYNEAVEQHQQFSDATGCFFGDIQPNNFLANHDFSDIKIIDACSIEVGHIKDFVCQGGEGKWPLPESRFVGPKSNDHFYRNKYHAPGSRSR